MVHLLQIDPVIEVAVDHQNRIVVEAIQGFAQTAAGAEDLRFILDKHLGPGCQRRLDLPGQVMAVDQDRPAIAGLQLLEQSVQQRLVDHRKQRFGANGGIRPQTGAVSGGEENGLHIVRVELSLTCTGNCSTNQFFRLTGKYYHNSGQARDERKRRSAGKPDLVPFLLPPCKHLNRKNHDYSS